MKKQGIEKAELAERMETRRNAVDRFLILNTHRRCELLLKQRERMADT